MISAKRLLAAVALLALAGCAGAGRTAAEKCAAAGADPATRAYARCVERTDAQDAANSRRVLNSIPIRGFGP